MLRCDYSRLGLTFPLVLRVVIAGLPVVFVVVVLVVVVVVVVGLLEVLDGFQCKCM